MLRRPTPVLVSLCSLALLGADDPSAPVKKVDHLVERAEWDKAMEVCDAWDKEHAGVRDIELRRSCARGELGRTRATVDAGAAAFLLVYKHWVGTPAGDEARAEYLSRSLKAAWDDRAALEKLVADQGNVQGMRPVADRIDALAFAEAKAVGTSAAIGAFLEKHPDSDEEDEATELQQQLAYSEAEAAASVSGWDRLLASFPDHPRRAEAEANLKNVAWRDASSSGGEALLAFARRWPTDARATDARRLALPGLLTVEARVQGNPGPGWPLQPENATSAWVSARVDGTRILSADADTFQVKWRSLDKAPDLQVVSNDGTGWVPLNAKFRETLVGLGLAEDEALSVVTVHRHTPDPATIDQVFPAGLCQPDATTRFAVRVWTDDGEAIFPFAVDAACRRAPIPHTRWPTWPAEVPGDLLDGRCALLRQRNGEIFRACGGFESVWPVDGAPFFVRIGEGGPGRPVPPDLALPALGVSADMAARPAAPLPAAVRAALQTSGVAPDCAAPGLPAGARSLVADDRYLDPEGGVKVVADLEGGPALQADVDLTGDGVVDRVLAVGAGPEARLYLLARAPTGDARAWPILGAAGFQLASATALSYKDGRYVAMAGVVDGACAVRVLRWGSAGPTVAWGDALR